MPLVLYLLAGLVLASITGGAYLQGRKDGRETTEARAARDREIAVTAATAAASAAADAISRIEIRHTTINRRLETEIRHVPVYTDPDCAVPADGLRIINDALGDRPGADPGPADPGGVPAAE